MGLRRVSFSLRDENDEICTAPAREQDFQPPGGSKTGPDSVRNSIFESSSTQEATSKPFWRLFTRLPADLGPTWGQLGANLGPTWGPGGGVPGGVRRGQNRSWRPPGPKKSFRGHLGHVRSHLGARLGVKMGSKMARFRTREDRLELAVVGGGVWRSLFNCTGGFLKH